MAKEAVKMSMDKGKAIEAALSEIEKKFGKGSIMRLGERPTEDIRMFVTVEEMSRKKIEKEYGYIFPDPKK